MSANEISVMYRSVIKDYISWKDSRFFSRSSLRCFQEHIYLFNLELKGAALLQRSSAVRRNDSLSRLRYWRWIVNKPKTYKALNQAFNFNCVSGPALVNGITQSCAVRQAVKCLAGSGTTGNCKLLSCPQWGHSAAAAKAGRDFLMISRDIKNLSLQIFLMSETKAKCNLMVKKGKHFGSKVRVEIIHTGIQGKSCLGTALQRHLRVPGSPSHPARLGGGSALLLREHRFGSTSLHLPSSQ